MLLRSRPSPFLESDGKTAAAEAAVEAAEANVEAAREKAAENPTPANERAVDAAEARLRSAEDRLAKLETGMTEIRQLAESRAAVDHDHPAAPPKAPEPDSTPKREPWWMRKIGGSR